MLSADQIQQLIKENKGLQQELQEVNYILEIKEQETVSGCKNPF